MRIGIVPGLTASDGGIYQYSLTMIRALDEAQKDFSQDEFVIFASDMHNANVVALKDQGWRVIPLVPPTLKRRMLSLAGKAVGLEASRIILTGAKSLLRRNNKSDKRDKRDPDAVQINHELNRWFIDNGVELMLYPISSPLAFETGIPYVMAIHDLQHRLQPEFPEVSENGEWEFREYLFRNGARYATRLLAESETGKSDILNFYGEYGVTSDRVKVLPLLPSSSLTSEVSEKEKQRVRDVYELPKEYLFYPAQFWPHKNHLRIVQALGSIKRETGLAIPILFSGFHTGDIREQTFEAVKTAAAQLQIEDQIHYLGYVPNEDMSALYAGARALVMPTFFGATNIPPLEAWTLRCPVLTSDIRGIREESGGAAILVDPKSIEAIARGMHELWTDDGLCHTLIEKGLKHAARFTAQDYRLRLVEIISEAKSKVQMDRAHLKTNVNH